MRVLASQLEVAPWFNEVPAHILHRRYQPTAQPFMAPQTILSRVVLPIHVPIALFKPPRREAVRLDQSVTALLAVRNELGGAGGP